MKKLSWLPSKRIRLSWLVILAYFVFSYDANSQCPGGAIGVTGAGCGCLAGCDLTSFGGPNCGVGVAGNCTAGNVAMSVDIVVPDGCTFTVTATMANAPGCTASGADAGDFLKVDIPAGPKPNQTGAGNATITDNYTLAGPGTIRVSGAANRADEIIVYSVTFSGVFCVACGSILPVELKSFNAAKKGELVELVWITSSEVNNDYFTIERSRDGLTYEPIYTINAIGNSSTEYQYKIYDSSPLPGVSYYRLKQTDMNGDFSYSEIVSVNESQQNIFYHNGQLHLNIGVETNSNYLVNVYDISGGIRNQFYASTNSIIDFDEMGVFLIEVPDLGIHQKIVCF